MKSLKAEQQNYELQELWVCAVHTVIKLYTAGSVCADVNVMGGHGKNQHADVEQMASQLFRKHR